MSISRFDCPKVYSKNNQVNSAKKTDPFVTIHIMNQSLSGLKPTERVRTILTQVSFTSLCPINRYVHKRLLLAYHPAVAAQYIVPHLYGSLQICIVKYEQVEQWSDSQIGKCTI